MRRAGGKWAVFAGLTLLLAALITLPLALTVGPPPEALAHVFALSVFYGICIGFPATWLLPRVGRRIARARASRACSPCSRRAWRSRPARCGSPPPRSRDSASSRAGELRSRFLTDGGVSVLLSVPMSVGGLGLVAHGGAGAGGGGRRAQAERLEAEARFSSLAAQLHPHFLFNTLNAIARAGAQAGAGAAVRMLAGGERAAAHRRCDNTAAPARCR